MPVTVIDIIKAKNAQPFPVVEDIDQLGGWRVVADTTERDAISDQKRKLGMWVYTRSDGKVWTLVGGLLNTNWIEVAFGGGGGGTKIYADESVLLATADPAGTLAYAADTGNFWFRRAATWQPIPGFQAMRRIAGTAYPTPTLFIDATTGDDGSWNDGTVTPLKTLSALFQRLPASMAGSWANYITVQFSPGDYAVPSDGLAADLIGNVVWLGSWSSALDSFTFDHSAGNDCHVFKPGTDPDWTVDQWVGYWVEVTYSSGLYSTHFPIIANGTHDLTVGLTYAGPWAGIDPTVKIVKSATRFVGPGPIALATVGFLYMSGILFEATASGSSPYFYWNGAGNVEFSECHFKCANTSGNAFLKSGPGAYLALYSVLVENGFSAFFDQYGTTELLGVTALNTNRFIEASLSRVLNQNAINCRNSSDFCFPSYYASIADRNHTGVQFINSGALWACWNRDVDVSMLGGGVVLDGKTPGAWIIIVRGCHAHLSGTFAEATVPGNSIQIWYSPRVSFSIADFDNLYGGDYDYGFDTMVSRAQ